MYLHTWRSNLNIWQHFYLRNISYNRQSFTLWPNLYDPSSFSTTIETRTDGGTDDKIQFSALLSNKTESLFSSYAAARVRYWVRYEDIRLAAAPVFLFMNAIRAGMFGFSLFLSRRWSLNSMMEVKSIFCPLQHRLECIWRRWWWYKLWNLAVVSLTSTIYSLSLCLHFQPKAIAIITNWIGSVTREELCQDLRRKTLLKRRRRIKSMQKIVMSLELKNLRSSQLNYCLFVVVLP